MDEVVVLTLTLALLERAIIGTAIVRHYGMKSHLWIVFTRQKNWVDLKSEQQLKSSA